MCQKIKSPALAGGPGLENQTHTDYTAPPKKWKRALQFLLTGESATRFEAERRLNDHTLPSTVSSLQAKGLTILRRDEVITGFQNMPTRCCRYWLDRAPENLARATALLDPGKGAP